MPRFGILIACLLFVSCTSYIPRYGSKCWVVQEFANCAPCYRSSEAYYPPHYPCGSLSLELIKDSSGLRMYVNLLLVPVCPEDPFSDWIIFDLTIDGITHETRATVLEGGQRLLLNETNMNTLIEALLAEQTIHIHVSMHSADINPSGFAQAYETVLRAPM